MNRSNIILLKNIIMASSSLNKARHTSDKKVKRRAWGALAIEILLGTMLAVYVGITVYGYGYYGMGDIIPMLLGLVICLISFVFTFFKAGGYLLAFREYDMLMAMPIKTSGIVWAKFMHMFILGLKWCAWITIPVIILYGYFMHPNPTVYVLWLILVPFISLIATVAGSVLSILISGIGANFKHKRAVQTILTVLLVLACFFLEFIIGADADMEIKDMLATLREEIENVCNVLRPAKWFAEAINDAKPLSILLVILSAVAFTELFIRVLSIKYKKINSRLTASSANRDFKLKTQKAKNIYMTIAYKEFKRMTFSTTYMTNIALGGILTVILGVAAFFVKPESLMSAIQTGGTGGIPEYFTSYAFLIPAIPFFAYLLGGMMMSTCCSLSLEGKSLWIIQSMPIDVMTLLKGKMLFNMLLITPPVMVAVLGLSFCLKAGAVNWLLFEILSVVLCAAGTVRGMCCGVRFVKYDWVNEIEVIKQGTATAVYVLSHMFGMMILITLVMSLSAYINTALITVIFIVAASVWTLLDYRHLCRISAKRKVI